MNNFKFQVINPLLHSELRLKVMVALDSLESADFMYLCQITDSTRGNLSAQITTLKEAGYLEVTKSGGLGRFSRTVCRITSRGREALPFRVVQILQAQHVVRSNRRAGGAGASGSAELHVRAKAARVHRAGRGHPEEGEGGGAVFLEIPDYLRERDGDS